MNNDAVEETEGAGWGDNDDIDLWADWLTCDIYFNSIGWLSSTYIHTF